MLGEGRFAVQQDSAISHKLSESVNIGVTDGEEYVGVRMNLIWRWNVPSILL